MGLAGPRKRVKLAHDPNNTKWTRDTGSFGHKIMAAQGWQPGEYLGARDAAHAEHFTAANASHIRVTVKDDNLGLGAKRGSGQAEGECTGLDVFKNLLGRLNGQDGDEMETERKNKEDLRNAIYAERKWGSVRFVSGGFLIGDKIQDLIDKEADRVRDLVLGKKEKSSDSSSDSESEEKPVEKKRKADDTEEESSERSQKKENNTKRSKDRSKDKSKKSKDKSKKRSKSEVNDSDDESSESAVKKSKKDKKAKDKVDKRDKEGKRDKGDKRSKGSKKSKSAETSDEGSESTSRRDKKAMDKEDKKSKGSKKSKAAETSDEGSESTSKKAKKDKKEKRKEKELGSGSKSPVADAATPDRPAVSQMLQGRHAVRARNIAQKRMAVMDLVQLNQIFMVKS